MLSDETGSLAFPALLGLTTGFGLWITYIYGLTLLALLGFWVWYDKGILRLPRVLWFALGFGMGFSPWIVINVQTHFAGLVIYDMNVWEHFGLAYLWDGLAHPRRLAPVEFFVHIASDDTWDLYRRAVNLLYSLLYLGPILTAGVLRMMKTGRSAPAGVNDRGRGPRETRPSPTHPTRPDPRSWGLPSCTSSCSPWPCNSATSGRPGTTCPPILSCSCSSPTRLRAVRTGSRLSRERSRPFSSPVWSCWHWGRTRPWCPRTGRALPSPPRDMPTASCHGLICTLTPRQARTIPRSSRNWYSGPCSPTSSPNCRPRISGSSPV